MLKLPVDLFVVVLFWNAARCIDAARGVREGSLTPLRRLDNDFKIYRNDHEDDSEMRSSEEMAADDELMTRWDISSSTKGLLCIGCVTIDLVFHVFTDGLPPPTNMPLWDSTTDELLTEAGIANQLLALNRHFSLSPFQFNIKTVRRVVDPTLANALITDTAKLEQMRASRTGGSHVANIYWFRGYCNPKVSSGGGVSVACGRATLPFGGGIFPDETYRQEDFVYMCPLCMSNKDAWGADGKTLTHEVGHWLGLYHTVRILYMPALSTLVVTRKCCLI
jgi:hypothetical protein